MDIAGTLRGSEMTKLQAQVDSFNKKLEEDGRTAQHDLGKDDFLKILITQLQHQDPTDPMKDKEFIAQMAQFSTLEQMNNLNSEFAKLAGKLQSGQAADLLGRTVEIATQDGSVTGTVTEVGLGEYPQVLVNGTFYDYSQVKRITE